MFQKNEFVKWMSFTYVKFGCILSTENDYCCSVEKFALFDGLLWCGVEQNVFKQILIETSKLLYCSSEEIHMIKLIRNGNYVS